MGKGGQGRQFSLQPFDWRGVGDDRVNHLPPPRLQRGPNVAVHLAIPPAAVADPTGIALQRYLRATAGSPAVLDWYLYDEPEIKSEARPQLLDAAYSRSRLARAGRFHRGVQGQ